MNKQALTFLSLFSLILVLSVYYMLLPEKEVTVTKSLSQIEQMQADLDKRRENIQIKNQDIIAQQTSTTESIKIALQTIKDNENAGELEKTINETVKKLGYEEVFSELEESIIHITIVKKDATKTDASTVIKTVLDKVEDKYQIQVKFIE